MTRLCVSRVRKKPTSFPLPPITNFSSSFTRPSSNRCLYHENLSRTAVRYWVHSIIHRPKIQTLAHWCLPSFQPIFVRARVVPFLRFGTPISGSLCNPITWSPLIKLRCASPANPTEDQSYLTWSRLEPAVTIGSKLSRSIRTTPPTKVHTSTKCGPRYRPDGKSPDRSVSSSIIRQQ